MSSTPEPLGGASAETSAGAPAEAPVETVAEAPIGISPKMRAESPAVGIEASAEDVEPQPVADAPESKAQAPPGTVEPVVDEDSPSQHPLVRDLMLNPSRWRIWPAVAVLRWLQRLMGLTVPRIVFRSHPSLGFAASEVRDILFKDGQIDIVLNAPGLATAGSPMPSADIARVIADYYANGALSAWLDGPGDRFMHILEDVQMRSDPAYALLAGGRIEAFALARDMVGRSAPLSARRGAEIYDSDSTQPEGAVALAGLFLGPASASGLSGLIHALTGLPVQIREFAGAEVEVARPARIGEPFGLMLGPSCRLPSAGVEVHIDGGDREDARAWAREATRRASLHLLATAYIGAPSPSVRVYLRLDGNNAPPAALDNETALGGLAVLGTSNLPVSLPLAP